MKKYNFREKLLWIILLTMAFGIVNVHNTKTVRAADASAALAEQNAGLTTAPDNLGLDPTMFTKGDFSSYGKINLASLLNKDGKTSGDLKAIRMTYNSGQAAAIWSNVEGGNYIDITKKQTLSMWMYFGPSVHSDGSRDFGDGMAFVLQNSSAGVKAFTNRNNTIGAGETLGVWGIDNDYTVSSASDLAKTAIQNSWALEFDNHVNNSSALGGAAAFDTGISGPHIAYGYPADAATYNRQGTAPSYFLGQYLGGGYYYTQNHLGTQAVTLNNGKWHHLTVSWNPTTSRITYSFNDKDPDGSKGKNPITATTDKIDGSKFGTITNNQLRWGFTATTGDYYQANLIAFESIPSSAEGDATSTIYDNTQAKTVGSGDSVNSNDSLAINYDLTYDSGRDPWSGIEAKLKLPDNVTYTPDASGNIGQVTYSDGSTENIPASEMTSATELNHALSKNLYKSSDNVAGEISTAKITLNGMANSVLTDTSVDSQRSVIDSDVLIKDVDTTPFVIKKSKPIDLTLDQSNISVANNKDANITGIVSYSDGSTVTNSKVTVYATLNGTALDNFTLSDNDSSGKLNFTIPADKLTETTNKLVVYVKDSEGNKSASSTVTITKKGSLSLKVGTAYSFGVINQSKASNLIARKGVWNISVNDSRDVDSSNTWNLSASTAGLYNGTDEFNGNLIYKNSNGIEQSLTGTNAIAIANGVKTVTGEQITNIAESWNDANGILLRSNGISKSGAYQGTIKWTLSDTI